MEILFNQMTYHYDSQPPLGLLWIEVIELVSVLAQESLVVVVVVVVHIVMT